MKTKDTWPQSLEKRNNYLAIALTHTVYFCKSVLAQCKCTVPELASRDACYNLEQLLAGKGPNHPLETMCKKGWGWLVVSDVVEDNFPSLAMIWSGIANNTHAGNSQKLDMESALELANGYGVLGSWSAALQAVLAGEPACKEYMSDIYLYVKDYGGGADFPIVRYLSQYSSLPPRHRNALPSLSLWPSGYAAHQSETNGRRCQTFGQSRRG